MASTGADLNKVAGYNASYMCKNIGGVLTAYTMSSNTIRDGAFTSATMQTSILGTAFRITCNGVINDNIVWTGVVRTYTN